MKINVSSGEVIKRETRRKEGEGEGEKKSKRKRRKRRQKKGREEVKGGSGRERGWDKCTDLRN